MPFSTFGLLPELTKATKEKGYLAPTPIQVQAIPLILKGDDLLAGSQTGTGKTAGFTLPLLHNLMIKHKSTRKASAVIRGLILTPTRELAMQVEESVKDFSRHLPLKSIAVFGGVNIKNQIKKLKRDVDIIVATPGRLLDLISQRHVTLGDVEILVLDEADRMLDMGFIPDIRRILKLLPKQRQTLFFSATFSQEVKKLANDLLISPKSIQGTQENTTVAAISQVVHPVDSKRKGDLLSDLIREHQWKQTLIFMRTKHGADRLVKQLQFDGISCVAFHGDKTQGARLKALKDFKNGTLRALVATDIAARGIDIDQLPRVVNFDLPHVPEDYIHRIGRTGRSGNKGEAISLVSVDERYLLKAIERFLKQDIPKVTIPNFEPDLSIAAKPISNGRYTPPKPRPAGPSTNRSTAAPQQHSKDPAQKDKNIRRLKGKVAYKFRGKKGF